MTQSNCNLHCGCLWNSDWSCEESYLLFFAELMQAVFTQLLLDAFVKVLSFCLIVGNCSKCSIHMSKNKVKICTGGGEWELRVWWWPKEHGSSRQKYFQEFYELWIQNLNSWKKNQTCLCYLGAKLFLPWCLKKKLFQLSKISPDLNLKDPLRRRFN